MQFNDSEAQAIAADIGTFTDTLAAALDGHTFTGPDRTLAVVTAGGYLAACEAMHDGASVGEFLRVMRAAWDRAATVLADMQLEKPPGAEPATYLVIDAQEPNCPRAGEGVYRATHPNEAAERWAAAGIRAKDGVEVVAEVQDLQSGDAFRFLVTANVTWTAERVGDDPDQCDEHAVSADDLDAVGLAHVVSAVRAEAAAVGAPVLAPAEDGRPSLAEWVAACESLGMHSTMDAIGDDACICYWSTSQGGPCEYPVVRIRDAASVTVDTVTSDGHSVDTPAELRALLDTLAIEAR